MNVDFTCSCQMKIDLENSADVFSFLKKTILCLLSQIIWIRFPLKNCAVPVA